MILTEFDREISKQNSIYLYPKQEVVRPNWRHKNGLDEDDEYYDKDSYPPY